MLRNFIRFVSFLKIPSNLPVQSLPRATVVRQKSPQVPEKNRVVWLTKRLSEGGVCSRRQAERMIETGMIKVNGKTVWENLQVSQDNQVEVHRRKDLNTQNVPIRQDTKLWVFYKPKGLITTHDDPKGRPTVFGYLRAKNFPAEHVISVGRLDYNSEGLLLLTNNGDLARAMELPTNSLEREYKVRAYGKFTEEHLENMRKGVTIKKKQYRPMVVWVQRKQTSNTWFRTILTEGKNREIRRIFEHYNLRVNRLVRLKYGPYRLEGLKPGEWTERPLHKSLHKLLLRMYKEAAEAQ